MNLRIDLEENEAVKIMIPGFTTPVALFSPTDPVAAPRVLPLDGINTVECELCAEQDKTTVAVYSVHSQVTVGVCANHLPKLFQPPKREDVNRTVDSLRGMVQDLS